MPRFTPDSIMGQIWKAHWIHKDLGSKEPAEIQNQYAKFCRHYRIHAPCWEPLGPYPDLDESDTKNVS